MEWVPDRSTIEAMAHLDLPDLIFEQEVKPSVQRGVLDPDPDCESGDELQLSPLYPIYPAGVEPFLDLSGRDKLKFLASGKQSSPKFLMASRQKLIVENSKATFRMDGRGYEDRFIPGSFFPLSRSVGASALHMIKDEHGQDLSRWRVALRLQSKPEWFMDPKIKRAFLDAIRNLPECPELNDDPVLNLRHFVGSGERYIERSDIGFWEITQVDKFRDSVRPQKADKFDGFWLPCSLEVEAPDPLQAACGMISYPCSSIVGNPLSFGDRDEKVKLFTEYSFLSKDEYLRELEKEAVRCKVDLNTVRWGSGFAEFRRKLSRRLWVKIERALWEAFDSIRDGDCTLSVGTVVGHNSTMVATSLSSLGGSSGAPIFLLKPSVERVFFAVLNGPPMKAANYNLATSTDNPTFVLQYMSTVLDTLPPPLDGYWKNEKQQLSCFSRWLVKHIATLRTVAVTANRKLWLTYCEEEARRKALDYDHV